MEQLNEFQQRQIVIQQVIDRWLYGSETFKKDLQKLIQKHEQPQRSKPLFELQEVR